MTTARCLRMGNPGFRDQPGRGRLQFPGRCRTRCSSARTCYTYNFAPDNALQLPLERTSAFARAEFELSDSVRIYAQGLYSDYSVTQQLAADAAEWTSFVPVNNPFVPADLRAAARVAADDPDRAFMLFEARLGNRAPYRNPRIRRLPGDRSVVAGDVLDDWQYEVYAQVGANDQVNHQTANLLTSRIEELTFAPDGGVSICGGSIRSARDRSRPNAWNTSRSMPRITPRLTRRSQKRRCPVRSCALPAGDLKAAFGVFYKEDKYQYAASPEASVVLEPTEIVPFPRQDIQGFSASDDIKGDDHNLDVYAELLVPLLRDAPGRAVAGGRSSATGCRTMHPPEASIRGKRSSSTSRSMRVRLRGSYQQAVRAPSVLRALPSRSCWRFDDLFPFSRRGGSLCRRQPGKDRAGCCPDRGLVPRPGHTRIGTARFRGLALRDRSHRRKSGSRPGGGRDQHARCRLDIAAVESAAHQPAGLAGLVRDRYHRQDRDRQLLGLRPVLLRPPVQLRISRRRTSGARCSRATRSPDGSTTFRGLEPECLRLGDERYRRAGRLAVRPGARADRA